MESIKNIIIESLKELNEELNIKELENPDENTKIYGEGGLLDSLALVTFITDLEEKIEDELGYRITLVNERAMSRFRSPFKDVKTLSLYIQELIKEENKDG
ncbi:MAG: hypothetical protein GXO22_07580 [Aquificae bacterium]|nr:hypothetical protein [Aquificota bacterium]